MTTTQSYAAFANGAREATEKSVAAFTLVAKPLTAAAAVGTDAPKYLAEPVRRYVQYVQQAARANVELATKWTQLVAAFSGVASVLPAKVGEAVQEQVETVSDGAASATETLSDAAVDAAETVADQVAATAPAVEPAVEQLAEVDDEEQDLVLEAGRAEAKHADELAREPYRSLTKAELSALLAERGLPKTGTVGVLIERLVAADAQS